MLAALLFRSSKSSITLTDGMILLFLVPYAIPFHTFTWLNLAKFETGENEEFATT